MQNDRRSSSSQKIALLVLTSVLGMSGCSSGTRLLSGESGLQGLRLTTVDAQPEVTELTTLIRSKKFSDAVEIRPASSSETDETGNSQWCKYLKEDSAAQATILRSPTLSGSAGDSGKASLSLGLSTSSFAKANLVEEEARIRCRRYLAESGLQKLVFISPQGLTAAGFRAKSKSISARKGQFAQLKKLIKAEERNGNINTEKATSLVILIDQIVAEGNAARSQADRRLTEDYGNPQNASVLGYDLLKAEADLDNLNSRVRTADAMDVSVSAGWNDNKIGNGFDNSNDSFSGKVSFSVKLGVLAPQRFEHERLAREAKLSAIRNQEGGSLWQIDVLRKAHERALDGLITSRVKLDEALAEANRLVTVLGSVENPEFVGTLIAAKIQVVRLQADKAAIIGSIQEIGENIKRLKMG
jgi:hypothetical protein